MKKYHGNKIINGASFDLTFYAKTNKEAAEKIETTPHYLVKYYFIESVKIEVNNTDLIEVEAYGSRAVSDYGFSKEKTIFNSFKELKKEVDKKRNKFYNN